MPAKKKTTKETIPNSNLAESLICEKKFNLSPELQQKIREEYRKYDSLLKLTKDVFENPLLVEDSDEFKNVKNFVTRIHSGQECYMFTQEQIDFIVDNGFAMKPMDITRLLFPATEGNPLKECKSVVALLTALDIKYAGDDAPVETLGPYNPPATDHKVIALINKIDPDANYHISKLDSEKKRRIAMIKKCFNSSRIVAMLSIIKSKQHREVFESQLILSIIDKPDLSWEEISGYANLANDYVRSLMVTEEISNLNDRLAEATADTEESRKFTKNLSDSLGHKATEYNACQTRMRQLHDDLSGKRSSRLDKMGKINQSLAKYIELAKTEEGRGYLLKLERIREAQLADECKRLDDLGELIAEIRGVSVEEILKFNI